MVIIIIMVCFCFNSELVFCESILIIIKLLHCLPFPSNELVMFNALGVNSVMHDLETNNIVSYLIILFMEKVTGTSIIIIIGVSFTHTHAHTHTCTHTRMHTHTHACTHTHTRTHARMHARTHTHNLFILSPSAHVANGSSVQSG